MKRLIVLLMAICCAAVSSTVHAVGLLPVPVLKNVGVTAETRYDAVTGFFTYAYTVTNPVSNTGEIDAVWLDILHGQVPAEPYDRSGLTIPQGGNRYGFDQKLPPPSLVRRYGLDIRQFVPFGQNVPPSWHGGLAYIGAASFSSSAKAYDVKPGQTLAGFEVFSRGVPTLRNMDLVPSWVLLVDSEDDVTHDDRQAAGQVERDIRFHTVTLGPSGVRPGDIEHWNQVRDDLARTVQLGWITDLALATTLTDQLAAARSAVDAQIPSSARARLNDLLAAINAIRTGQCRAEVQALMRFNAEQLLVNLDHAVMGRSR